MEKTMKNKKSPLNGLLVLDLSRVLAGPYATMVLSDLGARVIKIEPPNGDDARQFGPFIKGKSTYFSSLNRNKELAFSILNKKVITPTNKEIKINPPSRSAKLRSIKRNNTDKIDTKFLYKKFKNLLEIEKLSLKL